MHFKTLAASFALSVALAFSGAASATVVTFDDLSGSGTVTDGYGGINWGGSWTYYDTAQDPYNPASGSSRVYSRDNPSIFTFNSSVVFNGAYFSGFDVAGPLSFDLFLGGSLVHSSGSLLASSTPTFLSSGYGGQVDKVSVNGNVFYVMDDVTYNGAIPEPATWAMMIIGFGAAGSMIRRRKVAVA